MRDWSVDFVKRRTTFEEIGSKGVMRFGKKGHGPCRHFGKDHPTDRCRRASGACFLCKEIGHLKRDCPQAEGADSGSGSRSQATVQRRPHGQSRGGSNQKPRSSSQVFSLRNDQAVDENERVIAGTILLCGIPAFVIIDTGAFHSFVSARFVKNHKLPYTNLDAVLSFLHRRSVLAKCLVLGCPLEFEGNVLMVNIMLLAMEEFDCILGIDMLTTYRASMDCYQKLVRFHLVGDDSWEAEFGIELMPGTSPILKAPYLLAPSEMHELKNQLQDPLDKGYIRPSVSPWRELGLFTLREKQLYANLSKCEFWIDRVVSLGHVISSQGISVDLSKIEVVLNWLCPTTLAKIRSLLGLTGYYRHFISNFLQLTRPLTQLTRKGVDFELSSEREENLCELHRLLTFAPVLALLSGSRGYVVYTDASLQGYVADESHILQQSEVQLDTDLTYVERLLRILDQKCFEGFWVVLGGSEALERCSGVSAE
ncbi:uncharacterized protein [Henckelia pumila]|uniref:uncharacterized protein n=1 Tax=Henckelia pumila TaxID=405737 RepID=UPI003C6E64AE